MNTTEPTKTKTNLLSKKFVIVLIITTGIVCLAMSGIITIIEHEDIMHFINNFIIGWFISICMSLLILAAKDEIKKSSQK